MVGYPAIILTAHFYYLYLGGVVACHSHNSEDSFITSSNPYNKIKCTGTIQLAIASYSNLQNNNSSTSSTTVLSQIQEKKNDEQ
tara:strand:+ start:145 stop:396 length:252 start_codon:yes stop_codon:yes gene_type:complete